LTLTEDWLEKYWQRVDDGDFNELSKWRLAEWDAAEQVAQTIIERERKHHGT
jgi:hypothetical protein